MKKLFILVLLFSLSLATQAQSYQLKLKSTSALNPDKHVWEETHNVSNDIINVDIDDVKGKMIVKVNANIEKTFYKVKTNANYLRKHNNRLARMSSYDYKSNDGQCVEITFREYKKPNKKHRNIMTFRYETHIMVYYMNK